MATVYPTEEVVSLVRLLLLETTTVSAIVEDRITGPFSERAGEIQHETLFPRVVLDIVGGAAGFAGAIQSPIMHVYAYSRTSQGDAYHLYDVVRPVLRRARLARTGITVKGMIEEVQPPVTGFNPQTNAWFARGTYRVIATALPASA